VDPRPDVTARYDAIADFYDESVGDDLSDPVAQCVLALVGDVRGKRVLELACGQGRVARELAHRGAVVVGADLSRALLARARGREQLGIDYVEVDVTAPHALAGESFDAVVCHFGLSDIDDLAGALTTVARVLRPGGPFVFSIVHPCLPGWGDQTPSSWPPGRGYYAEGWWKAENEGFRSKVGSNHRTLATYLNGLVEHGLALDRVAEPAPGEGWLDRRPPGEALPVFLVVRCRRDGGA
jgi:SAM-dependent methyltransferase